MSTTANSGLREVGTDLWELDRPSRVLGHRMTVARLSEAAGGGLWLHSPVPWSPALAADLDVLAPPSAPRHLVIPSRTHDLWLGPWLERIPAETTWAPPVLQRAHPDWAIGGSLRDELVAPWAADLEHRCLLGAPRVSEVAFLHRPSGTLVLVDSVFHLTRRPGPLGRFFLWVNGVGQGPATSRLFRAMVRDRAAFAASLEAVLAWEFARVLVGHGSVIEGAAVADLRAHLERLASG